MRKSKFLVQTVLLLVLVPLVSWGADALVQLEQFVDSVATASGNFAQKTLASQSGAVRSEQSGQFSFKRPGQFKWHIKKPYEQLLVSDGSTVLQYDPDLEQVTERPLDQSMGSSPAAILFGSRSVTDSFEVELLPDRNGLQWLRAVPKQDNAGFTHVDIGLKQQLPVQLLLLDVFGQMTEISLDDIQANPELPDSEFRFHPPSGVDVIKMQPGQP